MRGIFIPIGVSALLLATTSPASAQTRSYAPVKRSAATATFRVTTTNFSRASLTAGAQSKPLDARSLRRAAAKGSVTVPVPKRLRRADLRLRVSSKKPPKGGTPTPAPTPAPAPAPAPTPAPTPTPTPTPSPSPAPTPTPTTGTVLDPSVVTIPTAGPALADSAAAALVKRSSWEPRTDNAAQNGRVPTATELQTYRSKASNWGNCNNYHQYVTGNFTGTTDEIIQWAAVKWGLQPDLARAVAVFESNWYMSAVGDGGVSFGLMQVKSTVHGGTAPLSQLSTAYNADFWAAMVRYYYDGCAGWLNQEERGQDYAKGDIWGSIGAWYAGRWHTAGAESYISQVKARLAAKTWSQAGF